MSRITNIFNNLKKQNKKAFIAFITAGDGGLNITLEIMFDLAAAGVDIIEVGVPFSDPVADGPTIAKSYERALADGASLSAVFSLIKDFRAQNDTTAIVLMGYLNPVEIYGYEQFALDCEKNAVDGALIVDSPPEESVFLKQQLDEKNIDLIFLIAPTTTDARIHYLKQFVSGFVYFVSLKGITGSGNLDVDLVNDNLMRIKKIIDLPVCVGFGVKNAISAKAVTQNADGVIVGSAFIEFIEKYSSDKAKITSSIRSLAVEIAGAVK